MKPFEYYSQLETRHPLKKDHTTLYAYDKGELLWFGPLNEKSETTLLQEYPGCVIQRVFDKKGYDGEVCTHYTERRCLEKEFEDDLFEEFGVTDNPKKGMCLASARNWSATDDHSQVYDAFSDLVNLIKD